MTQHLIYRQNNSFWLSRMRDSTTEPLFMGLYEIILYNDFKVMNTKVTDLYRWCELVTILRAICNLYQSTLSVNVRVFLYDYHFTACINIL